MKKSESTEQIVGLCVFCHSKARAWMHGYYMCRHCTKISREIVKTIRNQYKPKR